MSRSSHADRPMPSTPKKDDPHRHSMQTAPMSPNYLEDNYNILTATISSYQLKKAKDGRLYASYVIWVTVKSGLRWTVEKRYHQFRSLRRELIRIYPKMVEIPFPPKLWFFNLSESVLKSRQAALGNFLNGVVAILPQPLELAMFLEVVDNVTSNYSMYSSPSSMHRSASLNNLVSAAKAAPCINDFNVIKVLGKGSFGKVFLVRPVNAYAHEVYAMKVLRKRQVRDKKQEVHTKTERWILENIKHPYILSLRYAFQTSTKLYLVTDYCSGGELFFHLRKMTRFTEGMVRYYVAQIALALDHLHENKIIYRDLKPENILLDKHGNCRLTDFGLAKVLGPNADPLGRDNTFCGTPEYLSPEALVSYRSNGKSGYTKDTDWWALGIVTFELLVGNPPFFDRDAMAMAQLILKSDIKFPSRYKFTPEAKNLVRQLLQKDPSLRLCCGKDATLPNHGIQSLQNHMFFSDTNWTLIASGNSTPPFVPSIGKDPDDTRNFDREFTKLPLKESLDENSEGLEHFANFSFSDSRIFSLRDRSEIDPLEATLARLSANWDPYGSISLSARESV